MVQSWGFKVICFFFVFWIFYAATKKFFQFFNRDAYYAMRFTCVEGLSLSLFVSLNLVGG